MKIVIINGKGGCGKDTLVSMCRDILGDELVHNISTVDFIKEIATRCGWDGTKTPENRKFLSDLKDLLTEWNDIPLKRVIEEVDAYCSYLTINQIWNNGVAFIHCREPKEIDRLKEALYDYDVTTLLIHRPAAEEIEQINHADNEVFNYVYDYTIWNDKNLSWLYNEAKVFLRDYLKFNI